MEYLQQNWMWILAAVAASVGLSIPQISGQVRCQSLTDATLNMNRNHAVVLDVRSEEEFSSGHIKGAKNIPFNQIAERLPELDRWRKKSSIIIVCAAARRAAMAYRQLAKEDFKNLVVLQGGIKEWQKSLPLVKS